MSSRPFSRRAVIVVGVLALVTALPLAALRALQGPPVEKSAQVSTEVLSEPVQLLAAAAERAPEDKIQSSLMAAIEKAGPDDSEWVFVRSARKLDLAAFSDRARHFTWPAGEQLAVLKVRAADVAALAAVDGVSSVEWGDPNIKREQPQIVDPEMAPVQYTELSDATLASLRMGAPTWAETQAVLDARAAELAIDDAEDGAGDDVPDGPGGDTIDAGGSGAKPDGWFDALKGHSAAEAWALGYTGEGVRVAVLDTSVDFAHQDLQGSWAEIPDGLKNEGWPQVFDPISSYLYSLDIVDDETNPGREAASGFIEVYQESAVTETELGGDVLRTACFIARETIINADGVAEAQMVEEDCAYGVPESAGDMVRYGHHPDGFLANLRRDTAATPPKLNEFVGVLMTDADGDGTFETVYVDANSDHDFRDEKPVTKDSPLSWREFGADPDGIADLSGGLLYFIADGTSAVPGAYLWGLEETIELEDGTAVDPIPAAGSMIAIHYDTGGHGTACASNVASRGRLGIPAATALKFRDLEGETPKSANPGMAKGASVVAVGNIYAGGDFIMDSAWRYGVLGGDEDRPEDDPQITSNSYGFSDQDNDGWDTSSRVIDYYVREFNPSSTGMYSTGNGAPGYGTIAPPAPRTGMSVGASTQMGSTGWDSVFEMSQITFGDVTPWSNRGPGAVGDSGPNVTADGAYAGGASPINSITTNANLPEYRRSGEFANGTWGGTSRSSPVAAGIAALVYQAFEDHHGRWPTWAEARSILMASSRFNGYDVFTAGAGVLDAGDAVRTALGMHGVAASPSEWTAGSYRGDNFPGFTNLVDQGETSTGEFTLSNWAEGDVEVTLSAQELRRTQALDFEFTTKVITDETAYVFNAPNYFIPLVYEDVPEGTDLLVVRAIYPLDKADTNVGEGDPDGNQTRENAWRLGVFQHTDWDDDGRIWEDFDGDGTVDAQVVTDTMKLYGLDGLSPIDYERSEVDEGEYMRLGYNNNDANNMAVYVHHPLERWNAGMYIGLWHLGARTPVLAETTFQMQVEFFDYGDADFVTLSEETLTIPGADGTAAGTATFTAELNVREDAAFGAHQLAIFADYPRGEGDLQVIPDDAPLHAGYELPHQRLVVPVSFNVAPTYDWSGSLTLGGEQGGDEDAPYDNGAVFGTQSWGWRPESGDWRMFFVDALSEPRAGTHLIARTTWDGGTAPEEWDDIDTIIMGPTDDQFSNPEHEANADEDRSDPDFYGPYALSDVGKSPNMNSGAGRWAFNTSSGGGEDWITAPAAEGLHGINLHNVLFGGTQMRLPFETTVSSIWVNPSEITLFGAECATVEIVSQIDLPGVSVAAYGLSDPVVFDDEPIEQDDPDDPSSSSFKYSLALPDGAGGLTIELDGRDVDDLDLFLVYDANGDGVFVNEEVVASSLSAESSESISIAGILAPGSYQVWVLGWSVAGEGATFDMTVMALVGDDLEIDSAPEAIEAGVLAALRLCIYATSVEGRDAASTGALYIGPSGSASMLQVPVTWRPESERSSTIYLPFARKGEG